MKASTRQLRSQRRLDAAFAALDIEALSIAPVAGSAPWSPYPRTFVVSTAGHGVVKVRLMRHEHRAERVDQFTKALRDPRMPALLGRMGATTVERWVDGSVLKLSVTPQCLDAAADILALLHRFPGLGNEHLPRRQRLGKLVTITHQQLDALTTARTISRREASAFGHIVDGLPAAAMWGLIHTDFGGDNLVVREDDTVVSIDNEHLVRGFADFDVARSWYRWPMPAASWRRFIRRYEGAAGRDVSADALRAWRVVAATTGVRRRLRLGVPLEAALGRLRGILDE